MHVFSQYFLGKQEMNSRRVALASVNNAEALLMYLSGFDNITFVCNSCSVKLISALSRLYLV